MPVFPKELLKIEHLDASFISKDQKHFHEEWSIKIGKIYIARINRYKKDVFTLTIEAGESSRKRSFDSYDEAFNFLLRKLS
jgi:hypothetical protein